MEAQVLLVCDDPAMAPFWAQALAEEPINVLLASSCAEAQKRWEASLPDLVVIDLHARPAERLCRGLRSETANPVLVLVPPLDDAGLLKLYEAGVDEAIVEPVSPALLLAKVRAWLRRSHTVPAEALDPFELFGLRLDPRSRLLETKDGRAVKLTSLELRLLYTLMRHAGRVFPADVLVERVWGYSGGDNHALRTLVYRLRRKMKLGLGTRDYIETLLGGSYIFREG